MNFRIKSLRISGIAIAVLAANPIATCTARSVEMTRLWTGYRETSSFVRLSEFFTGKEQTGRSTVLRSQPSERDGFYYIIRLVDHDRETLPDGIVVIQIIAPDGEDPRTFQFPFRSDSKHKLRLDVGITGSDWTYGKTLPLAWKLEVLDGSGAVIAHRESFLWTKPRTGDA